MRKRSSELRPEDFRVHPVWEFLPEAEGRDETWVKPVAELPVNDLGGRVVGTFLRLASGGSLPAVLGNISLNNAKCTKHFLTATVFRADGERFDLARYHDVDVDRRGPSALAAFLETPVDQVFPMEYDISQIALGSPEVTKGLIRQDAPERLSQSELIDLALE